MSKIIKINAHEMPHNNDYLCTCFDSTTSSTLFILLCLYLWCIKNKESLIFFQKLMRLLNKFPFVFEKPSSLRKKIFYLLAYFPLPYGKFVLINKDYFIQLQYQFTIGILTLFTKIITSKCMYLYVNVYFIHNQCIFFYI